VLRRPVETTGVERTLNECIATSEFDPISEDGTEEWSVL
jgi:hypothetical protein